MTDEHWMQHAITLAARAEQQGEVPVGAVLVKNDHILGEGWNQMIGLNDPSAHAEMQAIRAAAVNVGNYRLVDCSLYVTLEPCCMCAGVMVHSRIKRLIFGTHDAKTGAAGSVLNVVQHHQFNHQL
ncbi:tRNA adenosine(34) deaminase TadA, partial [Rheinheimera baltica]|uniref:tRNA adenosine(34) deaminase TadA n=1 Tax=Rheinheimera baltica TaxID=67576 RepID=UPI00273D8157